MTRECNEDEKSIKKIHELIQDKEVKVKRLAALIKERKKQVKNGHEFDPDLESKLQTLKVEI
jgi:hypothetical protein